MTFFKDLDIDAVRKAQKEFTKLNLEHQELKLNIEKSETSRIKAQAQNKKMTKQVDLLVKEIEKCIELNNDVLEQVQHLRKEISHHEVADKNSKINIKIHELVDKVVPVVPDPGIGG